jgi:PAS domain S-box-containing protein
MAVESLTIAGWGAHVAADADLPVRVVALAARGRIYQRLSHMPPRAKGSRTHRAVASSLAPGTLTTFLDPSLLDEQPRVGQTQAPDVSRKCWPVNACGSPEGAQWEFLRRIANIEGSRRPMKSKEPRKRKKIKPFRMLQMGKKWDAAIDRQNAPEKHGTSSRRNQELTSADDKLRGRNHEIREANIDIFKLLSSLNLSMLLMDRELRIRRVINEILLPLGLPDIKAHIVEVMDSLKPMLVEVRGPDEHRYELQIRPYFSAGKKLEGAVVAVADITELTKRTADLAAARESLRGEQIKRAGAEEVARAGEVRFQTVADSLPELIAFVDAEQRYQFCNKSYENSLHISPNEFIGRTVREVVGEAVYSTFESIIQKALSGQSASYEGYVSHKRFGRRYLHIDYIPHRDAHGNVDGFYSLIRNLTELKDAEEQFRALIETSPQAKIIQDAKGKIVIVNSEAERIFGYGRQELIGQPVEMLMPARFRQEHVEQRQAYMRRPIPRPMGAVSELYAQRKDGSAFPVEISLSPVQTSQGVLVSSTIVDITERKRHEEQTRWTTIVSERARMARDVHDTLAQGFTGIILNLEAAEEACADLPKEARDRIARARDVARSSLEEARTSVLALSSPLPPDGDLISALRELVVRCRFSAKTQVEFSIRGTAVRLARPVMEDLLRIVQHAVDNVLKHAHASSVHIEIAFHKKEVRLQIKDDGRGFDVRKVRPGAGLTGMHERVREIGGKFTLNSKPGKGTRVEVRVPLPLRRPPKVSR